MRSTYLNIMFRYTLALIFAMFLKVLIVDMSPITEDNMLDIKASEPTFKYSEITIAMDDSSFKRPSFKNKELDQLVSNYIEKNACTNLSYNIYDLEKNRVNVFLDCGTPENIIYDYKNNSKLSIKDVTKNYSEFINKSKTLLKLKYPTFVVDDINFDKTVYNIRKNEIIGFYNSQEYGNASYHINYNEIRDFMDYPMEYDDAYENEVFKLDPNKKAIAFTFDDGPSTHDLQLIDILENSHSTATFFVVGNRIPSFPTAIQKLASSKMEVGNHTYDHKSLSKLSNAKILEEIVKTNDMYYNKTGKTLNMLRPSYGAVNKRVLLQVRMPVILWDIDTLDWKTRNADKVYNVIMNEAADGSIVLMHSLYKSTVEAVDRAVKELYKEGYQIVSVSELARLKNKTLLTGYSYASLK